MLSIPSLKSLQTLATKITKDFIDLINTYSTTLESLQIAFVANQVTLKTIPKLTSLRELDLIFFRVQHGKSNKIPYAKFLESTFHHCSNVRSLHVVSRYAGIPNDQ